jgi:ketosteroid isomerase-like protein
MKICVVVAALACVFGSICAAEAQERGAKAIDAAWLKAIKANDLEALVACYAPDAVLWLPGAPEARGAKTIRDAYAGMLAVNTVTDATIVNAVYQTSGDLSAGWGNFTLSLKPKNGGAPVVMKGRFIDVAKKVGGKWAYVSDHASSDPPPPAPPK